MPTTRRGKREQRLSDFFPAIDAPSPIAASSGRKTRSKTTFTPAQNSTPDSTKRKAKPQKRDIISTPIFDPDVHIEEDENSHDSEEESFVRSLCFSAAKPRVSTPRTRSPSHTVANDYEVMVDYNSDSDGFAFSPVKFTPSAANQRPNKRIRATPLPTSKLTNVSRMVWNSATRKVENRMVEQIMPAETKVMCHKSTPVARQVLQQECSSDNDSSDSQAAEVISSFRQDRHSNQGAFGKIPLTEEPSSSGSSENQPPVASYRTSDERATSTHTSPLRLSGHVTINRSSGAGTQASTAERSMPQHEERRPLPRNARGLKRISTTTTRSPRISLVRAVSGSLPMQRLEKLPLPDYVLSSETDTLRKMTHRQEPHARLVKIIPTTVPKPFGLSKARPKLTDLTSAITKDHRAEELHIHRDSKPALRGPMTTVELPILDGHVPTTRGKRKFSEAQQQEVAGMSSPAKRIKVQHDQTRPILPARGQTSRLKHQSIVPSFEPPSAKMYKRTAEQTGSRFLRQAAGGERAREADIVGVVPRTVYSPEKQFRINKVASPTKPQPFKFSTEARAGRSPAVRRPLQDGPPVPRKLNSLHVPALKVAPFVPKPSDHPATIAASPARKLPSRLQTRREFDKVAEKHAEEVVQKRRREEELLAAERERRMNERRGWQDSGRAAIEQWAAARAKITSDGKRAWID